MSFINDAFLLRNRTAQGLYDGYVRDLPIIDYHCHLNPAEIAADKRFSGITEAWLGGDHYKWRLMRLAGVDESCITGSADDWSKFSAWVSTVQTAIGNPLYHWAHLELKRFFDIDLTLCDANAREIFDRANAAIRSGGFSARDLIIKSHVETICTTDDPTDTLEHHRAIAANPITGCTVRPTFRPDRAVVIDRPDFCEYMDMLGRAAGIDICDFDSLLDALDDRVTFFHDNGCRLSDHDFGRLPYADCSREQAAAAFDLRLSGGMPSADLCDGYKTYVLRHLSQLFVQYDWTMQLHCGAMRNNSTTMFNQLGRDTGYDTMSDYDIAVNLSRTLDGMEQAGALPRTVVYTLNPKDNYPMIALCGAFAQPGVAGKVQFGAAWWFVDHYDGMVTQMRNVASMNLLSSFIGMLTDSRSFLSYTRHEYFRRILCNMIGEWVENGEFPDDRELLGRIVSDISYGNAKRYFKF